MRRVVVLPQPDGPSKVTSSPGATVNDTSSTAGTSLNRLLSTRLALTEEFYKQKLEEYRKVGTVIAQLRQALDRYDAWAAGLRRDESPTRANTPVVSFEHGRGKVKIAPMAQWTQADVDAYISRYNVPVNTLIKQGYASVGCWPCTRRTPPGGDPRSGRWPMFDKTECGLHK